MIKFFKWCLKCAGAGITAIAIVSVLLCMYSLTPVHEENPNGNTDYVWAANSVWVNLTEGISCGRFDKNGYNNLEVADHPDVLILGSSHMEARNVMQKQNVSYLLGEKLAPDYSVYNLGISAHTLYKVCQYLPKTLELYKNSEKMIIIETSTLRLNTENVNQIIDGNVEFAESHSGGVIAALQKIPFFRAVYNQVKSGILKIFFPVRSESAGPAETNERVIIEEEPYDRFFAYLADLKEEYGVEILIFYHPEESLEEDGTVTFFDNQYEPTFSKYADKYDIHYVNMEDNFRAMYEEEYHVPHGFTTGLLADGHLNRYGHAAIADRLYDEIMILKENGKLCK